jgi:hypothetical protein
MQLSPAQRRSLAAMIDGYSFTVQPGETLYWPHQWLHGTCYHEPSFSFVLHFGRDLFSTFVSREVYRCFYRHAVVEHLYPAARVTAQHWPEFLELHATCKRDHADARERFVAVETTLRSLYDRFYPDRPLDKLGFDVRAIRGLEEASGTKFYDPEKGSLHRSRKAWASVTEQPLFDWW